MGLVLVLMALRIDLMEGNTFSRIAQATARLKHFKIEYDSGKHLLLCVGIQQHISDLQ